MKAIIIIPARYASSRFPGKPLADIHGKPMIQWVYENSSKAALCAEVYVATDDDRIADAVQGFGGNIIMTDTEHRTGTDRIWEAYQKIGATTDVIVNVQGDEPYIEARQIDQLINSFEDKAVEIATLIKPYLSSDQLFDENKIRVVIDKFQKAMYFSRSAIPFVKNVAKNDWHRQAPMYQHIGMYAYRSTILEKIVSLDPSSLEQAESLEQLRWMENGFTIHTELTDTAAFSIDTPEDLEKLLGL